MFDDLQYERKMRQQAQQTDAWKLVRKCFITSLLVLTAVFIEVFVTSISTQARDGLALLLTILTVFATIILTVSNKHAWMLVLGFAVVNVALLMLVFSAFFKASDFIR